MKLFTFLSLLILTATSYAQVQPKDAWWLEEPYRLVQTNLREIDAIDFDLDVYVKSITEIGANTVLINVGGIVANYYTDLEYQFQNPYLKFNMIDEAVDRLHREGIRVIGRFDFSKLNETLAAEKQEWLYKSVIGETVNFNGQVHTCFNGGYQQEYSLKILEEALSRFPLDGVFFNMIGYKTQDYSGNDHGICQADACRERFHKWSGGLELPQKSDNNDPVFRQYQEFQSETLSEFFFRIHDLTKSFGNNIAIYAGTYAGTDFYRTESRSPVYNNSVPWNYRAAHLVKSVVGSWKDKQVSNTAVHFHGPPARHSADANWLTQQRLFQNIMYGAGLDFYCIGRLDNLEDRNVLQQVTEVFQFHKKNKNYLHHNQSGNKVLVLHDQQSSNEYRGIFEMLTENHILFDVMEHWVINGDGLPREIESYEVVILPGISRLSDEQCRKLDNFVENGGKLLATGFTSTKDEIGNPLEIIRLKSLGVEPDFKAFKKEPGTYFRIFEKDKAEFKDTVFRGVDLVYVWEKGMLCNPKPGVKSLLGYIPPAMIGPPEKTYYTKVTEIPGLVVNEFGKGKTAIFPFQIGTLYHQKRHYGHKALVMSALKNLLEFESDIQTDASPLVEISRQKSQTGSFEWYALMNHSGQLGHGFFEPVPVQNISLTIKPEKPPQSVTSLKTGRELLFELNEDGLVKLELSELGAYDIILIEY